MLSGSSAWSPFLNSASQHRFLLAVLPLVQQPRHSQSAAGSPEQHLVPLPGRKLAAFPAGDQFVVSWNKPARFLDPCLPLTFKIAYIYVGTVR